MHRSLLLLWLALALGGCTVGPDYRPPNVIPPDGWDLSASSNGPTTHPAIAVTTRPVQITQWWATLGDPILDSLIQRATQSNLDLKLAEARLREARARRSVISGDQYPTVDITGGYTRERISQTAAPFSAVAGTGGFPFEWNLYQLGFDASWELDIFGGTRRAIQAANADVQASTEDRRFVLLSVLAEVARNYVELRGYQRQLDVANKNLQAQKQAVEVTRDRRRQGIVTELDVSRAVAQAAVTEGQIPALANQQWQAIHRLAVLLGQEPRALAGELSPPQPIPLPPNEIPVGLPSELLRRRPDVRRAERNLAAATARIGVAVADLFPRFSLTGTLGLQSSQTGDLFDWSSRNYTIGPALRWPIFDFGRLRAQVGVRNAQQEQALVQYQQAVLTALRETDDAIVALQTEQQRQKSLADAVAAQRDAAGLAENQYRQGITDFLTVLEAQRSLYDAEDALARSEEAVATDVIVLYKALGGGWEIEQVAQR